MTKIAVPQVKEILTNYGPSPCSGGTRRCGMNSRRAPRWSNCSQLQPGIITNNRLGGGFPGDTETPEQFIPATGFPGRDWETCMTMNDTWGYQVLRPELEDRTKTLLRNLVDIVSKGGNYLLNVGPTAEGVIPQPSVDRLAEMGTWMKVNGEAIYGTTPGPFKKLLGLLHPEAGHALSARLQLAE